MKKLFLFLTIVSLSFISCSENEDNNTDPIIGTWGLFSKNDEKVNDCQAKSTMVFNADGTSFSQAFIGETTCISFSPVKSVWKNNGDGTYYGKTENQTQGSDQKVVFTDNNNTMTFTDGVKLVFKRK